MTGKINGAVTKIKNVAKKLQKSSLHHPQICFVRKKMSPSLKKVLDETV